MSLGAVAATAGIIALEPTFMIGATLGVALVEIGLAILFFAAQQWGLLGTATRCWWRAGSSGLLRPISPPSTSPRSRSRSLRSSRVPPISTSQQVGQSAIIFAGVSLPLVNFGFWIGSLWGDYPCEAWVKGEGYWLWSDREARAPLHVPEIALTSVGRSSSSPWELGRRATIAIGHHRGSLWRDRVLHTMV
jgi:hypothetical protein